MNLAGEFSGAGGHVSEQLVLIWRQIKAFKVPVVAPILNVAVYVCMSMTLLLFVEWVYMGVVIGVVKMFSRTPEKRFKWEALEEDAELGNGCFPMVLVQIPMYNEREVYKLSIGAACGLSWPSDRIIVQVLDDSTDPTIKEMVEMECQKWASNGIDIKYEIRGNRNGYKAGALSEGMKRPYVRECDYVVVFDADFQPEPDFLHRTIPFLVHNPNLALVQARWKFGTDTIFINCFARV
nr:glucomannan 4-beta-mannosyltransferase 9-like [Ipomoea batatas]